MSKFKVGDKVVTKDGKVGVVETVYDNGEYAVYSEGDKYPNRIPEWRLTAANAAPVSSNAIVQNAIEVRNASKIPAGYHRDANGKWWSVGRYVAYKGQPYLIVGIDDNLFKLKPTIGGGSCITASASDLDAIAKNAAADEGVATNAEVDGNKVIQQLKQLLAETKQVRDMRKQADDMSKKIAEKGEVLVRGGSALSKKDQLSILGITQDINYYLVGHRIEYKNW